MYVLVIVQMDAVGKSSMLGGFNSLVNINKHIESASIIFEHNTKTPNNSIIFPND